MSSVQASIARQLRKTCEYSYRLLLAADTFEPAWPPSCMQSTMPTMHGLSAHEQLTQSLSCASGSSRVSVVPQAATCPLTPKPLGGTVTEAEAKPAVRGSPSRGRWMVRGEGCTARKLHHPTCCPALLTGPAHDQTELQSRASTPTPLFRCVDMPGTAHGTLVSACKRWVHMGSLCHAEAECLAVEGGMRPSAAALRSEIHIQPCLTACPVMQRLTVRLQLVGALGAVCSRAVHMPVRVSATCVSCGQDVGCSLATMS